MVTVKMKGNSRVYFFAGLGALLLVLLAAATIIAGAITNTFSGTSGYSAVYLTSGDIYFGKLHASASGPYLTNVLYLEHGTDAQGQTHLAVAAFGAAFWNPADTIHLTPSNIAFWAPLQSNSQLIPYLENPALLNQQQTAQQGANQNPAPAQPSTAPSSSSSTAPKSK